MRKGIATSTVIAIILGIVVLGLIGFWLFRLFTNVGTKVSLNDCQQFVQTKFCPYMKTDPTLVVTGAFITYCDGLTVQSEKDTCKACETYETTLNVHLDTDIKATCGISG
jgi:hypothetical protein